VSGAVLRKTLRDQLRPLVWWSLGVLAVVLLMSLLWTSIRDVYTEELMSAYPEELQEAFNLEGAMSGAGYLNIEVFSIVLPVLFIVFGVGRGARLIEGQQTALARMETLAAVGQMAGAIAHSLRNPMAGIRSSAELLRMEQPGDSTLPDDIIAQIDRMDAHVRELLDYARADTPRTQPLDVAMVVGEVLERLGGQLARAGVAVVREDRREAAGRLPLDPRLLAQAIETVVTNAAEAMPAGGRLVVRLEGGRDGTQLSFADTGPGIPAAVLPRVSEPFFTTKTRGLGLGLSITRRIVERFGGRLEIFSTEGTGTIVRMHLP